jgi:hypothetical protein
MRRFCHKFVEMPDFSVMMVFRTKFGGYKDAVQGNRRGSSDVAGRNDLAMFIILNKRLL